MNRANSFVVTLATVGVGLITIASGALANSTAVYVSNHTARTFQVWQSNLDYGRWDTFPAGPLTSGAQTNWKSKTNKAFQGTEGWLSLASSDGKALARFYWDNPFIGSNSYSVEFSPLIEVTKLSGGTGDDAIVFYDIKSAVTEYKTQNTPTAGPGTISGSVRWESSVGLPAPQYNPSQIWQAIAIQAMAPTRFKTPFLASTSPAPNETQWNGTRGTFEGLQAAGQLACRPAASLPAGYYGFDFTISNLPLTLPLQLEAKILDSVPWPPGAANLPPLAMLSPKYARGLVAMRGLDATLTASAPATRGMDFAVVGVWGSDPPGGGGDGSANTDAMAIIQSTKVAVINPNPVLGSIRARARSFQRAGTVQQVGDLKRVLIQPGEINAAPNVQLQKSQVKQYSR